MKRVILFDVNETLLDLSSLRGHFEQTLGDPALIQTWFSLLLHSSLVVTLAEGYSNFGALAGAALDLTAARHGASISAQEKAQILGVMRQLPPHPDVQPGLERLRASGFRLATLTNSPPAVLESQISNAGLNGYFEALLSVDSVARFKPAVETYRMAAEKLGVEMGQIRMVAAHDWDIFGALQAGCKGAYVDRGVVYHPLYAQPDIMGEGLGAVVEQIVSIDG